MYGFSQCMCINACMCNILRSIGTSLLYSRAQLDRRRLEEAHMKYSVLKVYRRYPDFFDKWCLSSNVMETLDEITPIFYRAFSQRYACK